MSNTLKNYSKEGQKLPMFGIGPYLIYGIAFLNALVIILTHYVFKIGILTGAWVIAFRIAGGIILALGILIWYIGAMRSGMDENITENKLKTDGIYSWVRNPMYTGCWFIIIGITFMWHNYWVLPMILVDWLILTIVLINTEEKWLLNLYGDEYAEYKKNVNRCIPWKRNKTLLKIIKFALIIIFSLILILYISLNIFVKSKEVKVDKKVYGIDRQRIYKSMFVAS